MEKTAYKVITYEDNQGDKNKIEYDEFTNKYYVMRTVRDDEGGIDYWEANEKFDSKKHFSELAEELEKYAKDNDWRVLETQIID